MFVWSVWTLSRGHLCMFCNLSLPVPFFAQQVHFHLFQAGLLIIVWFGAGSPLSTSLQELYLQEPCGAGPEVPGEVSGNLPPLSAC
jgi:hypothetical protein